MVDIAVKSGAAWTCRGPQLSDVLLPVHIGDEEDDEEELRQPEGDETSWPGPVLLEQVEDGAPCLLALHCAPGSPAAISRLLVVSEARTMEAYDQTGEYCGTVRGERSGVQPGGSDRGPFYRKQLILEQPSSACEVKLLSLGGRSSVQVSRVTVGLRALRPCQARGPGIDMQQVQCLVEEMGTSLSPGAQNLMDMVHIQQKNQAGSLGGFLPLLMGGGLFSSLAPGGSAPPAAGSSQPADSRNGAPSDSGPERLLSGVNAQAAASGGPAGHAQLAQMMSQLLEGRGQAVTSGDLQLLPALQSLCGQVTKLRLDDTAAEKEKTTRSGSWDLDSVMERRLEEMERRLKEHVDRRLDALEQKLEDGLLAARRHAAPNPADTSRPGGGAAAPGPGEQTGPVQNP